ncbi:MAG: toll/interleukin-1 receptor domain-containing protein [Ilumatobacter sp.]|uniref:toll/interleukin-1 receptor domain-containing protein n=1 Tax=Ilumatobacter sp. TaxID=1967498 RepID=UPI0026395E3C|nr:toll/interleukin-1 receptor domain-containing protein [Ilumatobacter sp.]MDJ0768375.1 toll/interleukin-1 receptor domain-containing protein [Ilumatobacter sp.]
MRRIFISYRREDTAADANALYQSLSREFGEDSLFKDVDNVPLGADWQAAIKEAVEDSAVLLLLMGSKWTPSTAVTLEVEAALDRDVTIIPLLFDEARIDALTASLQGPIAAIATKNGAHLDHASWHRDLAPVVARLRELLEADEQEQAERREHANARFRELCESARADGAIDETRRAALEEQALALGVADDDATRILTAAIEAVEARLAAEESERAAAEEANRQAEETERAAAEARQREAERAKALGQYRSEVVDALASGHLTMSRRAELDDLKSSLGVSDDDADRIETEIMTKRQARLAEEERAAEAEIELRANGLATALEPHAFSGFSVHPKIAEKKQRRVRKLSSVPNDERILAVLDRTAWGSAKLHWAFTDRALYHYASGRGRRIGYDRLATMTFETSDDGHALLAQPGIRLPHVGAGIGPDRALAIVGAVQQVL